MENVVFYFLPFLKVEKQQFKSETNDGKCGRRGEKVNQSEENGRKRPVICNMG